MKPNGITVVYFNDKNKNLYAKPPLDKDTAKRLSKRIYRNAMTALATERQKQTTLLQSMAIQPDNSIQTY